ncbi:cytochrome c, class I [Lentisphaera araneosa HTCC2155]|jgi:cytochrome c553|uniref:Cytochrome c, class I n=1 Tax=Lentisphaera araneosa HTCC2155 TaxID=313628 RepID=A6DGW7_9BACT|nr:c-type cytochrome [Lentisphaera araneosa]EDM28850.1 cytochrome c, class I [Lentisphaera araneosa HTCC2155]
MKKFMVLSACLLSGVLSAESTVAEQAEQIFKERCTACHLDDGHGLKSMKVASIAGLPRWYVAQQLRHFRDGKRGAHINDVEGKMMQSMTQTLDDKSVAFLGKHIQGMKPLKKRQTIKGGDKVVGEKIYKKDCASCHGENAEGVRSLLAPPLTVQIDWYLEGQLKKFNEGIRSHVEGSKNPTKDQTKDLLAYLSSIDNSKDEEK